MNVKIDEITFDVRFRYEHVYLLREKDGTYGFKTPKEVASIYHKDILSDILSSLMKSVKTTCTISEVSSSPDVSGKDKYKLLASSFVVCSTIDFPYNKHEGRKKAFGKTVAKCYADKQERKKLWDAFHKEFPIS